MSLGYGSHASERAEVLFAMKGVLAIAGLKTSCYTSKTTPRPREGVQSGSQLKKQDLLPAPAPQNPQS